MRGSVLFSLLCSLLLVVPQTAWSAEVPETYLAKVRVRLCRGYFQGSSALEFSYRIGLDPRPIPLPIVGQSLNPSANEGTFQFHLPRTLGTLPMHIQASCRSVQGYGPPSNTVSVSNCNFLAQEDNDNDGVPDNIEDYNCDNHFNWGDYSDRNNFDTDGDGVRDLVELMQGSIAWHPGVSPRPFVFSGGAFDPDGDGNSNAVVWRPWNGHWYIRDFVFEGNHIAFQFGLPGDTPFVYQPEGFTSNVGVIRYWYQYLLWFLNGPGFQHSNGWRSNLLLFGLWGDTPIPGPWETPGVTNPAVARLYRDVWYFFIYKRDAGMKVAVWGRGGDVPKVQDYDGDGVFDIAIYRAATAQTYVIHSRDNSVGIYTIGSPSSDYTARGDVSGDGIDDIIAWEPITGMYSTLLSDNGFQRTPKSHQPVDLQLGLFFVHVPMSWNRQFGKTMFTVVDHQWGLRYIRPNNDPYAPPTAIQWGLPGDSHG